MDLTNLAKVTKMKMLPTNKKDSEFDWKNELINASLLSGLTIVTTFSFTQNPLMSLEIAVFNGLLTFITRLCLVRGLIKK